MIESLVHSTVTHFPTLRPALGGFIRGISALAKQSPAVLEEWYGSPDDDPVHNQERTAQARRRCQRLVAWISTTRLAGSKESSDIATELYAIRNSAIAHASVHTTGNVFLGVIGPFGHLAAQLTCAAIALRAGCDLAVVFQDAQVDA